MNFKVPELGEGVQEGELIAWKVQTGDVVKMDQPLVEIMTDKATVEIPSPVAGTVKEISAKEGDRIKIGQVIVVIDEGAGKANQSEKQAPPKVAAKVNVEKEEQQEAEEITETPQPGARADDSKTQTKESPRSTAGQPTTAGQPAGVSSGAYTGDFHKNLDSNSVPASPYVRSLAAKAGVDLRNVTGSGPKVGNVARVLEDDVLKFVETKSKAATTGGSSPHASASQASAPQVTSQPKSSGSLQKMGAAPTKQLPTQNFNFEEVVERKPLRGLRRVIAQAMVRSKFTAPHFSYVDEFECSSLMHLREEIKQSAESYGIKFSYLPFIVKAVVAALKEFPEVNASLEENGENAEVILKKFYHIGIAVATDNGLIVPVIKHADKKSLLQIAQEIQTLSDKTRAGKATSDELKGSTFTITSMGNIGGVFATPIINYPEVAIMGVYKIQQKPVIKNGQVVPGNTLNLSLSCDHRVVDGAVAGMFCNAVIDRLAHPSKLMLEMI